MMFFAIVFGLSMDYEVFLLSRMKEEYHRTGDSHISVANGLAATARVITAAAAIMVFVFGSFLLENDRTLQAVRHRPGAGDPPRRHHRPHAARAGHDGAARRPQLVAAEVARPAHPEHRRRGHTPTRSSDFDDELEELLTAWPAGACSRQRGQQEVDLTACPVEVGDLSATVLRMARIEFPDHGMGEHVDWTLLRPKMAMGMGALSEAVYGTPQLAAP